RGERGLRGHLGFAADAGKTAVADDGDKPWHFARSIVPEGAKSCARAIGPQHAAVQQSRQRRVVDKARLCKNLVRYGGPLTRMTGERALGDWLWLCARRRIAIERNLFGQLKIAGPDITGPRNGAVIDCERGRIDAEPLSGGVQKNLPDFSASLP